MPPEIVDIATSLGFARDMDRLGYEAWSKSLDDGSMLDIHAAKGEVVDLDAPVWTLARIGCTTAGFRTSEIDEKITFANALDAALRLPAPTTDLVFATLADLKTASVVQVPLCIGT